MNNTEIIHLLEITIQIIPSLVALVIAFIALHNDKSIHRFQKYYDKQLESLELIYSLMTEFGFEVAHGVMDNEDVKKTLSGKTHEIFCKLSNAIRLRKIYLPEDIGGILEDWLIHTSAIQYTGNHKEDLLKIVVYRKHIEEQIRSIIKIGRYSLLSPRRKSGRQEKESKVVEGEG